MSPGDRSRRHERGHPSSEEGQALVEFALLLPLLFVIVLGMLDIGKAVSYLNDETHLANEAARFAAVNNSPVKDLSGNTVPGSLNGYMEDTAPESNELRNGGGAIQGTGVTVTFTFPNLSSNPGNPGHCKGDPIKVTVLAQYKWLHFLTVNGAVPAPISPIHGSATMRLERDYVAPFGGSNPNAYSDTTQTITQACP